MRSLTLSPLSCLVFAAFLCFIRPAELSAQTGGVMVFYPQNAENVGSCTDPTTLSVAVQVIAPAGISDSYTVGINFPGGIRYERGSLQLVSTNPAGISIAESNISNLNVPVFRIRNESGPMRVGTFVHFTVRRGIVDCSYYLQPAPLKDTVTVVTNLGTNVEDNPEINSYQAFYASLNIPPIPTLVMVPGQIYTREITVQNGGFNCQDSMVLSFPVPAGITHHDLSLGGQVLTPVSVSGNIYVYQIPSSRIPGGCLPNDGSIMFTQRLSLSSCNPAANKIFYTVRWGCANLTCQAFTREASHTTNILEPTISQDDIVITEGTFCTPARIRRVIRNTSTGPTPGSQDYLDIMADIRLGSWAPISLEAFTINGSPVTMSTAPEGDLVSYKYDFAQHNAAFLSDADGDGFKDDLAPGDSIVLEFSIRRSCLNTCPADFSISGIPTFIYSSSPCRRLEGLNDREALEITQMNPNYISDNLSTTINSPLAVVGDSPEEIRIRHSRTFVNDYFKACDSDQVTIRVTLSSNLRLSGTTATFNGQVIPVQVNGNQLTMTASVTYPEPFIDLHFLVVNHCQQSGWSAGDSMPYTITHTCHDACCSETWACGKIPPVRSYCPGEGCDQQYLSLSSSKQRKNYGYSDIFGQVHVNPATLPQKNKETFIHGDTLHLQSIGMINQAKMIAYHADFTYPMVNGQQYLTPLWNAGRVIYTAPGGTQYSCALNLANIAKTVINGYVSFNIPVESLIGQGCFPVGLEFLPGGSIRIDAYFEFQDIPTDVSLFPQGLNTLPTMTWGACGTLVNKQQVCCFSTFNLKYYNYSVAFARSYGATTNCDNTIHTIYDEITFSGLRDTIFPDEVRPLIWLDSISFDLNNFQWSNDSMIWDRYGVEPVANAPIYTSRHKANSVNGRHQFFLYQSPAFPIDDDQSVNVSGLPASASRHFAMWKSFKTICTDTGAWEANSKYYYKLYPQDAQHSAPLSSSGRLRNAYSMPAFVSAGSTLHRNGIVVNDFWLLRYRGSATRPFGEYNWIAVDTAMSDGVKINRIRETDSAGETIGGSTITLHHWNNGLWAQITGGPSTGDRYFAIDFEYSSCYPDTARVTFSKNCTGFPAQPLDAPCGSDNRLVTVSSEPSEIQILLVEQPLGVMPLCEPMFYKVIINSAQRANVVNPRLRLNLPAGIVIDDLNVKVTYPWQTGQPYELLTPRYEGLDVILEFNDLSNIIDSIGLPGFIQQPLLPERQIEVTFELVANCDFHLNTNFSIQVEGMRPCGEPATGNDIIIYTNIIRNPASSDYSYILLPPRINGMLTSCGQSLPLELDLVNIGTQSTSGNDTIRITLPPGIQYKPGSYSCTTDPATCPHFIGIEHAADGSSVLVLHQPVALPTGTITKLNFEIEVMTNDAVCSDTSSFDITVKNILHSVPCSLEPGGFCENVVEIKLQGSFKVAVRLPKLEILNLEGALGVNQIALTGNIRNTGSDLGPGVPMLLEFYCLDQSGNMTGNFIDTLTLYGPLDSGDIKAFSKMITAPCAFLNGVGVQINQGGIEEENCICGDVASVILLDKQIVCAPADTALCSIGDIEPFSSVQQFINAGGHVAGLCQAPQDLKISLLRETHDDAPCNRIYTRVYRISDNCGDTLQCAMQIVVRYPLGPKFEPANGTLPQDTLVECDEIPAAAILHAANGCSAATVSFEDTLAGTCPESMTIIRTWTALDECGRSVKHVQTLTVRDTSAPVLKGELPRDTLVECSAIPAPAILTATDNCSGEVEVSFHEEILKTPGNCPQQYRILRTWVATDPCRNSVSHTQTITVQDRTAPVWVLPLPGDTTVNCNQIPQPFNLAATDNCSAAVIRFEEDTIPGDCIGQYELHRTWTASDSCGNMSTYTQVLSVQDTSVPIFVAPLPADTLVNCNAVPLAATLVATDNCSGARIVYAETRTSTACAQSYTLTRTWTAIDSCGNSNAYVQVITVQDTSKPTLIGPLPQDTLVNCDAIPLPPDLGASNNCGSASVNFTEVRTDGNCPDNYTLTRTWVVSDLCGNQSSHVQVITVQDTTDPVFSGYLPADTLVDCHRIPDPMSLTATDNCSAPAIRFEETREDGDCPHNYNLIRTWTATDSCGNMSTYVQVVTVQDTTAPVFNAPLPQDTLVNSSEIPEPLILTATDNCSTPHVTFDEVRIDGACVDDYTLIRTWTATDSCGNEKTYTQVVTVQDTTPPVFVQPELPGDTLVNCWEVPAPDTLSASDDGSVPTVIFTETRTEGDCLCDYTLTRTWTASDSCGNETTHVQIISVQDTTAPVFVEELPQDTLVDCDHIPAPVVLTAVDSGSVPNVVFTEVRTDGDCVSNYTLTRTWTTMDSCGNGTTHTQIVSVQDTTAPAFVEELPADTLVNCDAVPPAEVLTATDNCSAPTVTYTEERTDGDCADNYILTRTWIAEDSCANTTTHVQVITVQDTTSPVFNEPLPQDTLVNCDAIPAADILTASNNCGATEVTFTEEFTAGSCVDDYILTRTWVAMDLCGNSTTHIQIVTVQDTTPPGFVEGLPADTLVDCHRVSSAAVLTATDNCSMPAVVLEEVRTDGDCPNNYTLTRTWYAEDSCRNITVHTQIVTVQDTTAPVFAEGLPADTIVDCHAVPDAAVLTATDECSIAEVTFTELRTDGNCPDNYLLTRTWIAADSCGNTSTHTQIVTVQDTTAPVFVESLPADSLVDCHMIPAPLTLTATDNCSMPSVTYTEERTDGNCPDSYILTRTWVAEDSCGNQTVHIQVLNVQDTIAPVFNAPFPQDTLVDCDVVPPAAVMTATDNCSEPVITYAENRIDGDCPNAYTLIRTWIARDSCNNKTSYEQTITVQDTVAPRIWITDPFFGNFVSGDTIRVQCRSNDPQWHVPVLDPDHIHVSDNCDANPRLSVLEERLSSTDCETDGYLLHLAFAWTARDTCGNSSEYKLNLMVVDTIAPVLSGVPKDVTVDCDSIPVITDTLSCGSIVSNWQDFVTVQDECECGSISFEEQFIAGNCRSQYQLLRIWIARDNCGNESRDTQRITVIDTIGPVFKVKDSGIAHVPNGGNLYVECTNYWAPDWILDLDANSIAAASACYDTTWKVSFERNSMAFSQDCRQDGYLQSFDLRWTATNDCGLRKAYVIHVYVTDTVAPVILNWAQVGCAAEFDPSMLIVEEMCTTPGFLVQEDTIPSTCIAGGFDLLRTVTAIDDCQNQSVWKQVVHLSDPGPYFKWKNKLYQGVEDGDTIQISCTKAGEGTGSGLQRTDLIAHSRCSQIETGSFKEELLASGNCIADGFLRRVRVTWTAADKCGKVSFFSVIVDVVPDNVDFMLAGNETYLDLPCGEALPAPVVSYGCSGVSLEIRELVRELKDCPEFMYIKRLLIATDACGHSDSLIQEINYRNGNLFHWGLPATICAASIPDLPVLTDPCTGDTLQVKVSMSDYTNYCGKKAGVIRKLEVETACGGKQYFEQTIITEPLSAPVIDVVVPGYGQVLPGEIITLKCGEDLKVYQFDGFVKQGCYDYQMDFSKEVQVAENCAKDGFIDQTRYVWVASDPCGNLSSFSFTVRHVDTQAPVFTYVPKDLTIYCEQGQDAEEAIAHDDCGILTLNKSVKVEPGNNGTITRNTWTATDACGNKVKATQVVTLVQSVPFECQIQVPDTIYCNSDGIEIEGVVTGGKGPYKYIWRVEGGSCYIAGGQGTPTIIVNVGFSIIKIWLKVIDANGCETECYLEIPCYYVKGDNALIFDNTKLYPNPAYEELRFEGKAKQEGDIKILITDVYGRELYSEDRYLMMGEEYLLYLDISEVRTAFINVFVIDRQGNREKYTITKLE